MFYWFGTCALDVNRRELQRGETAIQIEPQAFDLLLYLVQSRDRVVSKDDLIGAIWAGRIVSDSALTTRINAVRAAIGDSGKEQTLIRTFPRKGFRFVGEVREQASIGRATAPGSPPWFVVRAEPRSSGVLMGEEEGTIHNALRRSFDLIAARMEGRGGKLIPSPAGTLVAVFPMALDAVSAAADARHALAEMNAKLSADRRVHYRFGIAGGDVVDESDGLTGDAVERATTLSAAAPPDAIRLSENARLQVADEPAFPTERIEADEHELGVVNLQKGSSTQTSALSPVLPNKPSIVLLPFQTTGENGEEAGALAEGLRLDIQNALTKMSGVLLVAAGSANAMRGWRSAEAAARTGVQYVLEGTVQRSSDQARVTVQLMDTVNRTMVWSERYDCRLDRDFALQDEITGRIVTSLDVKLVSGEQARAWHKCLVDPAAREYFYRGVQAFIRMNRESIASARVFFERLSDIAPDSPFGPTWVALCLWFESTRGWASDPKAACDQAGIWAERAILLEDADGQAHTVLGNVRLIQRRFDEALKIANEALEIRPGCANANGFLANVLLYCGEPQTAILHARRALRFMPIYPPWFVEILATSYRDASMNDLGIIASREILRVMPSSVHGRLLLTSTLVRSGWLTEARRVVREAHELEPDLSAMRWASSQPYRDTNVLAAVTDELRLAGVPR